MIGPFVLTAFRKVRATAEHNLRDRPVAENDQDEASEKLSQWVADGMADSAPQVLLVVFLEIQLILRVLGGILVNWSACSAVSSALGDLTRE